MMDESRDKWIEKARALLAKAADTDHEAEAQAFEAKALALMAKWDIEERDLRTVDDDHETLLLDFTYFGNAGSGAASLACFVAELFGAYGALWSVGDRRAGRVKMTGTPSQLQRTQLLIDHLLPQLRDNILRDRPRSRKSYSLGWAGRVRARLGQLVQAAYAGEGALVPTSAAAREAFVAANGPVHSLNSPINPIDAARGSVAGEEADLGGTRLTA